MLIGLVDDVRINDCCYTAGRRTVIENAFAGINRVSDLGPLLRRRRIPSDNATKRIKREA